MLLFPLERLDWAGSRDERGNEETTSKKFDKTKEGGGPGGIRSQRKRRNKC